MNISKLLIALLALPCALSASTLVDDQFNDNAIDTSIWSTSTPGTYSVLTESGGYLTTTGRGTIVTTASITGTYSINLSFSLLDADEIFTVSLRSNGSTAGSYYELYGVHVLFSSSTISIVNYDNSGANTIATVNYTLTSGSYYSFTIVDTEDKISVLLNGTTIVYADTIVDMGNYVGFYSRENASSSATSIDYITITSVPEPSSYALVSGLGVLGFLALRRRRA